MKRFKLWVSLAFLAVLSAATTYGLSAASAKNGLPWWAGLVCVAGVAAIAVPAVVTLEWIVGCGR